MTLLFVYGTLKQGFPNHHLNTGRRVPGEYRTVQPLPLYVVRLPQEERAPWLMHLPGQGHCVSGQLFEVPDDALPSIDAFEEVGLPDGYERVALTVVSLSDGQPLQAFAYLKPEHQMHRCLAVEGPFPEYTLALAEGYWITRG
ncbi:gamma-glutamylcyclotransferase [Ideonella sp. 4Y16]|uniref:Gamma-glutamylcyclotransferase family protein n=1 Tax=Ideonella alba TaxID=2824118 RepID=A0A941BDY6_9BURK|nr:gamma-glutamylcyclotransferase family protein [Ideonella alba]MBQ0929402.1 gamma-glutamylcyclotransferase [Ideonella alba]MBQ0945513.1 gamma-glutamylcyclotransferase [Ideonella alba]